MNVQTAKRIPISDILTFLDESKISYRFTGDTAGFISNVQNLGEIGDHSFCWIKNQKYYNETLKSRLSSCEGVLFVAPFVIDGTSTIVADRPKEVFFPVLNRFFTKRRFPEISDRATVLTQNIGVDVSIGPGCYVGEEVTIGDHTVLHPNVVIDCPCTIGEHCEIFAGVVIGSDGFGYYHSADGVPHREVHLAGVQIGNHVDIGANSTIDRGLLTDTIIGDNVKIDNLCHIAHNDVIEKNCLIMAGAKLGGSAHIEKNAQLGLGSCVINQARVGEGSLVGVNSAAVHNVKKGITVLGVPAQKFF